MLRYCLFILIISLITGVPAFSEEAEETEKTEENFIENFVYDRKDRRDPFFPLIRKDGRSSPDGLMGIERLDDITLEGIVWDPHGDSVAIVNGEILKENQQVYNVKVIKIESKRISIMINENEFTINLIEEEGGK